MNPLTSAEKQELLARLDGDRPLPAAWRDRLFPPAATGAATEDELRRSRELLQAIVDNSTAAIYVKDAAGRYLLFNPECERLLHVTAEQALGRTDLELLANKEDAERFRAHDRQVLESGQPLEVEERSQLPDGPHINISVKVPVRDAAGQPYAVCGISTDITDRRRSETQLQQAHEELKALWDALPDLLFEVDRDGCIYASHARHPDLFYRPPEVFLGQRMLAVLPEPAAGMVDGALAEAARTGRHIGGSYWLDLPQGRRWFELSIAAKGDHRSPDPRFVMLVRDITKRKEAEEALRQSRDQLEQRVAERTAALRDSQERFELFMRHLPAIAFLKDRQGRYVFVNDAWRSVFPATADSCLGRRDRDVWPAATARQLRANDLLVLRTRRPVQVVEHVPQADGIRHWLVTKFPILDAAGVPILLGGAAVDITERRRLEEALLQISDREQRRIAQDLHDGLCQNLTGTAFLVRALHQRLADRHPGPAAAAKRVADLLETAIEDARRLSQGLHPVPAEPGGLRHALEQLAKTVTDLFAVQCAVRINGPVSVEDNTTATHLFRIAQEAVSNAVKHGCARQVLIGFNQRRDGLRLTVRDNGRGLPRKLPPGRGLGLQIMRYRAAAIGATLQVGRAGRRGTLVACTLRTAGSQPRPAPADQRRRAKPAKPA